MARTSKKNYAYADRLGGLIEAAGTVRHWWTARSMMDLGPAKKADEANEPDYLYIDDGEPELLCVTVQRVPMPEDYTP